MQAAQIPQAQQTPSPLAGEGWGGGDARHLARLLTWLSPSFPTGAFSYSHGLEMAVEDGAVRDVDTLVAYVTAVLEHGVGATDAAFFVHAFDAVADHALLETIAARAAAMRGSAEFALEAQAQGQAFLATVRAAWPSAALERAVAALETPPVHAVAVAIAAATAGIPQGPARLAFINGFAANLVSAALRLIPLGQTDGQRALARLEPVVLAAALRDAAALDEIASAAPLIDILSMRHETQYTRLFRS